MMPPVKEPLAGLALLVIFGLLIWSNRPIQSSPPFDPYPQHETLRIIGHDAHEAWLWKDPFGFDSPDIQKAIELAEKHLKKKDPKGRTCRASLGKILGLDKNDDEQVKNGKRVNNKNNKEKDRAKPVILAPLVKVKPNTVENKELRTRQRYAVVAGLIESGYQPQEPDRLHFCAIQKSSHEYDMRWERYKYNGFEEKTASKPEKPGGTSPARPDIIVAWIDSEILTADDKFPAGHPCTPACNFPFKNLVKELSKDNEFYLFDVNDILDRNRSESIKSHIECINEKNERKKRECGRHIELIKPAGMKDETGNQDLANKLGAELGLRGIKEPSKEVIIILEQGSENAGALANNIGKYFSKQKCEKQSCPESDSISPASRDGIRNIFYLKASDGNPEKTRARDKKDKNENQPDDKPERVSVIDLHRRPPLPIGPGQMDHFHRLAEEISNVHDTIDIDKRDSGAKAIVILGSDFNDKLLIIEALRDKLPHLLILTTDLDAQMLHSRHWRSTRNLIVASHFDLLLQEKTKKEKNEFDERPFSQRASQDRFPPFRDSDQTNIFYRTLAIADDNANSIDDSEKTFPRIFEVGRNGFVRLGDAGNSAAALKSRGDAENNSTEKTATSNYHPSDSTENNTKDRLWLLFGIALFLILFYGALRPRSRLVTGYLFAGTAGVFAIAYIFATDGSGEPLSFTDGVSLWPTILLQIVAILWAGAFFVLTMCDLDKNFYHLSDQYFRRWWRHVSDHSVYVPGQHPGQDRCRLGWLIWVYAIRGRMRSTRGWATFFVLPVSIYLYAYNDVHPSELALLPCLAFLVLIAFMYVAWPWFWQAVSIKRWDGDVIRINNISRMWLKYFRLGRFGYRLARVIGMWLIFAVIETLLVYLLPPWPLPWRGDRDPASWIGVLSFVVTMLLLFFVLDAVRLNYYWIKKLRRHHWQVSTQQPRQACTIGLLESLEDIVEVVAKRIQAVDKLIYYPMLCIVLMLFAKITYFDNQDLPLSKGITFGAAISFLFFSGFMLRHEANQLRLSIRKDVQDRAVGVTCTRDRKQDTLTRLDTIDEGAFQPMLEQPVMQALLIVLASIGLFAGEYLKLFG
jgi:hypothetical protein